VQWKEEKQQQLKKKKEEEAKAEQNFCCYRASTLFGYSFGRYFAGGKVEMYACFFFLGISLAFYWSFFPYETPECNFVCSGRRRSSSS
jgi:hypothetical protein